MRRNQVGRFLRCAMANAIQKRLGHKARICLLSCLINGLQELQGRVGRAADEQTGLIDGLAGPGCRQIPTQIATPIMGKWGGKAVLFIVPNIFGENAGREPARHHQKAQQAP